jgi:DNA-binding response OmpR family regulator
LKPKIMIHGKDLVDDDSFLERIQKNAHVLLLNDLNLLDSELGKINSRILIFEFSDAFEDELLKLKLLKAAAPWLEILVIDNGLSRDNMIRTLRSGIKDYFKKPYNTDLLVDRISALLQRYGNGS